MKLLNPFGQINLSELHYCIDKPTSNIFLTMILFCFCSHSHLFSLSMSHSKDKWNIPTWYMTAHSLKCSSPRNWCQTSHWYMLVWTYNRPTRKSANEGWPLPLTQQRQSSQLIVEGATTNLHCRKPPPFSPPIEPLLSLPLLRSLGRFFHTGAIQCSAWALFWLHEITEHRRHCRVTHG